MAEQWSLDDGVEHALFVAAGALAGGLVGRSIGIASGGNGIDGAVPCAAVGALVAQLLWQPSRPRDAGS